MWALEAKEQYCTQYNSMALQEIQEVYLYIIQSRTLSFQRKEKKGEVANRVLFKSNGI